MINKAKVDQLTDTVMAMITDDVRSGVVPWTVTTFGQLHDWVDANMYLEHAGQQFDAGDQDSLDEVNAIEDEVSRRLSNGELTGGGWCKVTWTVHQIHSTVLPLALLRQEPREEPLTADGSTTRRSPSSRATPPSTGRPAGRSTGWTWSTRRRTSSPPSVTAAPTSSTTHG